MKKLVLALLCIVAGLQAQNGARYLIITADIHEPAVRPLAEWKQARGLLTRVVKLSTIGTDTVSIRNFIRTAYNTWNPRPEYVLLVGSPALTAGQPGALPSMRYRYGSGGMSYSVWSEDRYADVNDDGVVELAIGRFPAKTATQAEVMVAKTLAYSQSPEILDTLWTRRMTAVVRDANDDDAPTYWADTRNAATLAGQNGYLACDTLASARGHTATDVVNSVNAGTNMVMYRGSATGNWYTPFAVNPAATTNGKRLPIILSFTCETMTLTPNESMVGEAWLKAGTTAAMKGGVGFIGTTYAASNVARFRSAACNGFFNGLFIAGNHKLGQGLINAKAEVRRLYPTYTQHYHELNLLGDPELDIWTDLPRAIDVEHPATVAPEPQTVTITVTRDGRPVTGADVCLSMDSTVYAVGVTGTSGEVTLDIAPTHTGFLRLVVTGHNLFPYDGVIPVQLAGVDEGDRTLPVRQRITALPSTFATGTTIALSAPLSVDARLRLVDAAGRTVVKQPVCRGATSIRLSAATAPAGFYRCIINDAAGALIGATSVVKTR